MEICINQEYSVKPSVYVGYSQSGHHEGREIGNVIVGGFTERHVFSPIDPEFSVVLGILEGNSETVTYHKIIFNKFKPVSLIDERRGYSMLSGSDRDLSVKLPNCRIKFVPLVPPYPLSEEEFIDKDTPSGSGIPRLLSTRIRAKIRFQELPPPPPTDPEEFQ